MKVSRMAEKIWESDVSWKIVQIDIILRPRRRPTDHRTPVMLSLGLGLKTKFFGLGLES